MKLIELAGYNTLNGGYAKDGELISDFLVTAEKIIMPDAESLEFSLEIRRGEKAYPIRVTLSEITGRKFLRKIPVLLFDESRFYKEFHKAVLATCFGEQDTSYQVNVLGLQEVNGHLVYVFSNGCIEAEGFSPRVYSKTGYAYIPKEAVVGVKDQTEAVENSVARLFEVFDCSPKVFYPLFLLNIAAISNAYFRKLGERELMKFTVWLDGNSGSGKTELAKAVGTFIFADERLNPNFVSATARSKYAMERFAGSSGGVFILDDIKNEKVRDRKHRVAGIVDDVLRSTYQGMLTDGSGRLIDGCSLITGEYMDTEESQNARLFYLKVDNFLKETRNSKALRVLQKNPLLLTTVCCSFIQWFLGRTGESSFPELLIQKIERMRNQAKEYQGINNAERLNENINMLRMSQELAAMFFQDIGMSKEFVRNFNTCAEDSIKALGESTYVLLGGESMTLSKVAENVLQKCRLRKVQFVEKDWNEYDFCRYRQEEFMIHEGDDFVYIEDMERSLQLCTDGGHDQYASYPYLLGLEKRVLSLFADEIENMQQRGEISPLMAERLSSNMPKKLKKEQIIFKKNRADSPLGRTAVDYPACNYKPYMLPRRDGVDCFGGFGNIGVVCCERTIQMNTTHPCMRILDERLEQGDFCSSIPPLLHMEYPNASEEKVYGIRKMFMAGKSLYRE